MAQGQVKKKKRPGPSHVQRKRAPQKSDGNKKFYQNRLRKGRKLITEREVEKKMVEVGQAMRERLEVVHKVQKKASKSKGDKIVEAMADAADDLF